MRENEYLITMISHEPRQIVGFDVVYPGCHVRNIHNRKDTFTVESINADLRHYIPLLARQSRCFARKSAALQAVMAMFVDSYNQLGLAKSKYRQTRRVMEISFSVLDFL